MSKKPIYRQIADVLRQQIVSGQLQPGAVLPTEAQLREQYHVSRVTVRQALKLLSDESVIESLQGSGWYVKEKPVNYDIYQLTSFYEKLADRNVETHSDVLAFQITDASPEIAAALRLTPAEKVYYVKRVRYINQKPVTLEETWMPVALFPDLSYQVMQKSKYHYIEQVKKRVIERSEQEIIPVMPSSDAVKALGIDPHKPILEKVSTGFLNDGTVFEFSRNFFKSDEYKFTLVARRKH
ncbi:GntR family transcriptional regulator [Serratia microhaemolytica]|uniref:GntR family transcriptional regulator n=1 Tax=Serratia microhaemolytica TaxID=2675110 RepID=UPI000FDF431A|nr:GntR family transcriptional regulator [Serratia microhaemolytica]